MDWKYLLTSFEGRINRAKYWAGVAVLFALAIGATLIDGLLGLSTGLTVDGESIGILSLIVGLANIYFGFALYAKRWHDRDKSGWWSLILLVPVIGWLWMLIECGFLAGTAGPNRFGPDPLA